MKMSIISPAILSLMFLAGIVTMSVYLVAIGSSEEQVIPEFYFWLGAATLPSSLVLLWYTVKKPSYLMLPIVISAFLVASIGFLRFSYYGTDLVGEYYVAESTSQLRRWPAENISGASFGPYSTCLSVTILPAIISEVTGLPMMMVFKILIPFVATLVVVGAFLLVRSIFGEKVATLSSIVFIMHIIFGMLRELLRQEVALLFLFLSLYLIFARHQKNTMQYLFLALVFLLLIPSAHYSMVYFSLLLLLTMFLAEKMKNHPGDILHRLDFRHRKNPRTPLQREKTIVPWEALLIASAAGFAWLLYVAYPVFSYNINSVTDAFGVLLGRGTPKYHFYVAYAFFSSLGLTQTIINWITRFLTIVGFFLALKLSKKTKSARTLLFSSWGGVVLLIMLIVLVLPNINVALPLDRVYTVGLIAFSLFIALSIIELSKRIRTSSVIFSSVIIVTLFLSSFTPISYLPESAASQRYLLSMSHSHYKPCDLEFAGWIQRYTIRTSLFLSDDKGFRICKGFAFRDCLTLELLNSSDVASLFESSVLLHRFVVLATITDEGYWFGGSLESGSLLVRSSDLNEIEQQFHVNSVYSNGRSHLVAP